MSDHPAPCPSVRRVETRGAHVAAVLVQHHGGDLPSGIALEGELRVNNLVEELIAAACVDRKGRLAAEPRLEMIALELDIKDTKAEFVRASVSAQRRGVDRDLGGLRRQL